MRVIGQRIKRMATIAVTAILSVSLASCGQSTTDNRTEISVWSWEPSMGEVIRHALVRVPEPIEWDGTVETPAIGVVEGADESGATVAH